MRTIPRSIQSSQPSVEEPIYGSQDHRIQHVESMIKDTRPSMVEPTLKEQEGDEIAQMIELGQPKQIPRFICEGKIASAVMHSNGADLQITPDEKVYWQVFVEGLLIVKLSADVRLVAIMDSVSGRIIKMKIELTGDNNENS